MKVLQLVAVLLALTLGSFDALQAAGRKLQPSDTIQVRVLNQPEFDTQARLSPDGTVSLPYLGRVRAAGLTEDGLARALANALKGKGVVNDPQVVVSTLTFGSEVSVSGAVKTPGVQVLDRPTTLAEAIARSGGANLPAGTIIVRRATKHGTVVLRYDQETALRGRGPDVNPYVQSGDQIYVEEAPVFFLYGYVNRPGAYPLTRTLTVQQALATGGGIAELGSEWRIDIKRQHAGQIDVIPADLDQPIQPNDTIVVKERIF